MKRRYLEPENTPVPAEESLCRALLSLDTPAEMMAFLRDLCTPAELEALIDRWRVVPYLLAGYAYREIHDRTSVSVTTIGRVARFLQQGNGGYLAVVAHEALPPLPKPPRRRNGLPSPVLTALPALSGKTPGSKPQPGKPAAKPPSNRGGDRS
ncbi:Trp operon repressor family [Tahibacter aquaticus]|uniref:Trp operon repressor family n=1 Tax=Tahibacter aquaticus TaxID=520092 RepID=A0A4R6YYN9_9GAMM|nr:Trp operon repressor family [Tahibacter aquaticus]